MKPLLPCLALLLVGCAETAPAPVSATKVANGVELKSFPPAVHLVVGGAREPFVGVYDRTERVEVVALAGHAKIAEEGVARLDGDRVVAIAAGEATLHVESELGAVDVPIVVHAAEPTALALDPVAAARIGEPAPVKATFTWAEGTSDATWDVSFSTDDPTHLHVPDAIDAHGWVAPLDDKPTTLRARFGDLEATTPVRAVGKAPVGIEIRLAWSFMNVRRFGAFARYDDGEEREISAACAWETDGKRWRAVVSGTPLGPTLRADQVSWDRTATCTVAGVRGSGSLFSP